MSSIDGFDWRAWTHIAQCCCLRLELAALSAGSQQGSSGRKGRINFSFAGQVSTSIGAMLSADVLPEALRCKYRLKAGYLLPCMFSAYDLCTFYVLPSSKYIE